MAYSIILSETDYLQHQLYAASQSKVNTRNQKISQIVYPVCFLVLSWVNYLADKKGLSYFFLIAAFVAFIFFPAYLRWWRKRYFLKYIREVYKNRFGVEIKIHFENGYIVSASEGVEAKYKLTELEEVSETANYFFLKVRTGETFILPKLSPEASPFMEELHRNSKNLNISWKKDLSWK